MITAQDVVLTHLNSWRELRAWGRSLANVDVTVSSRQHPRRAGTCWTHEQRLVVYAGRTIPDMLATGLHELAHAVEIADGHGEAWQGRFAAAVREVTGLAIPATCGDDFTLLDHAAEDAVAEWWRASGNALAARLAMTGRCA